MNVTEYVALENERLRKENAQLQETVTVLRIGTDDLEERLIEYRSKYVKERIAWTMLPDWVRKLADWLTFN